MATNKTPKIKHRVKVEVADDTHIYPSSRWLKDNIHEFTEGGYDDGMVSVQLMLPKPLKVGQTKEYTVTLEYLGERQYAQTYKQRVKALAASQKRTEKWKKQREKEELERQEKELVQRRQRIINQIELAFVKKVQGAVDFITCDQCNAPAAHLGLAYENPGSQVIDSVQITGAWCADHHGHTAYNGTFYKSARPYKTKAEAACERLEFFYDGLRQICVKAA